MKLNPNTYPYEFSINSYEEIDYLFLYDRKNKRDDIIKFLMNLISNCDLVISNGCDGSIIITEDKIIIEYYWINSIGLNWLGIEQKEILEFPNI